MNDRALLRVVHESAIRARLANYASAVDRLDFEAVRACYCDGAVDDHGTYRGPIEGLIEHLSGILARHLLTTHFLGNVAIEFVGDDVAVSETYSLLICRYETGSAGELRDLLAGVRYVDTWSLMGDALADVPDWKVERRLVVFDWSRIDAVRGQWDETLGFARRSRGPDDPWLLELERARQGAGPVHKGPKPRREMTGGEFQSTTD